MKLTKSFLLWFLMIAFFGCAPQKSAKEELAEKNKAMVNQMYEYFNAEDWDTAATIFAPEFAEHNPSPGQKPGFEGVKEMFLQLRSAFPDMKITANQIVAEGEFVCVRMTVTGTHQGEFAGMPATGKSFSAEGYDLLRLVDGRLTDHWGLFDQSGLMMQLGATPEPGTTQE